MDRILNTVKHRNNNNNNNTFIILIDIYTHIPAYN